MSVASAGVSWPEVFAVTSVAISYISGIVYDQFLLRTTAEVTTLTNTDNDHEHT